MPPPGRNWLFGVVRIERFPVERKTVRHNGWFAKGQVGLDQYKVGRPHLKKKKFPSLSPMCVSVLPAFLS